MWCVVCEETLELLLEAGADANKQNNAGDTPLHKAVAKTSIPCIKALIVCIRLLLLLLLALWRLSVALSLSASLFLSRSLSKVCELRSHHGTRALTN